MTSKGSKMIFTNTETIAGYEIVEVLGLVQGNTVRAKHADVTLPRVSRTWLAAN
jgi:uncharacterized protein YbjQ (UPF0145 family)